MLAKELRAAVMGRSNADYVTVGTYRVYPPLEESDRAAWRFRVYDPATDRVCFDTVSMLDILRASKDGDLQRLVNDVYARLHKICDEASADENPKEVRVKTGGSS